MKEMFSRASVLCMMKGETPSASTGAMIRQLGRRVLRRSRRAVCFPVRKRTTHTPEMAWDRMVARAAPRTPMWNA